MYVELTQQRTEFLENITFESLVITKNILNWLYSATGEQKCL